MTENIYLERPNMAPDIRVHAITAVNWLARSLGNATHVSEEALGHLLDATAHMAGNAAAWEINEANRADEEK